MTKRQTCVYIVDDDELMREGLTRLLKSAGVTAVPFSSAEEFLEAEIDSDIPCCLVLDIRMPGMTGLELQETLLAGDYSMPTIFITGHGDVPTGVKAMKKGAVDFLQKPFEDVDLLEAIETALDRDRSGRAEAANREHARELADKLTARERQVLSFVITGMLNKQIAGALTISERTVKAHRAQITEKLGIFSVAELVRFAEKAGIDPASHAD